MGLYRGSNFLDPPRGLGRDCFRRRRTHGDPNCSPPASRISVDCVKRSMLDFFVSTAGRDVEMLHVRLYIYIYICIYRGNNGKDNGNYYSIIGYI